MNKSILALIISVFLMAGSGTTPAESANEWHQQGIKFLQSGNPDKAIYAFTKAIELNQEVDNSYFGRAMAYVNLQKFPEAIADFTKVIKLAPGSGGGNVYFLRGQLYHKSGDLQRATADYISAARLGHESAQEILTRNGIRW